MCYASTVMDNSDENSPLKSAAIAALLGVPSRTYTRTRDAHPIYQMVGQVASEWAHLEHLLDELIWRLAGGTTVVLRPTSTGRISAARR